MVNGPTTPIPVKAKPSSTDPVIPPVTMGESNHQHILSQLLRCLLINKQSEVEILHCTEIGFFFLTVLQQRNNWIPVFTV